MIVLDIIVAQTIFQLSMGLTLTTGEIIGPVASIAILGLFAIWVLVTILRRLES